MRKWLAWGALLLVSCTGWSAGRSVVTGSPKPSPTGTLTCQLPVYLENGPDWGNGMTGTGFVGFPAGDFIADAAGDMMSPYFGRTYDWAALKWLPVDSYAVAPDGLSYVIPNNSTIEWDLVDARSGTRRALAAMKDWDLASYQKEGIYLVKRGDGSGQPGLWLLDTSTSAIRQVTSQGNWTSFGGGGAWDFTSATLKRLDLESGQVTTWYVSDGRANQLLGHDQAGRPLLALKHSPGTLLFSPTDLFELAAPGELVKLMSTDGNSQISVPVSDQHGVWFSVGTVIWLYSNGSLHKVATLPSRGEEPAGAAWVQVTGDCSSRSA